MFILMVGEHKKPIAASHSKELLNHHVDDLIKGAAARNEQYWLKLEMYKQQLAQWIKDNAPEIPYKIEQRNGRLFVILPMDGRLKKPTTIYS